MPELSVLVDQTDSTYRVAFAGTLTSAPHLDSARISSRRGVWPSSTHTTRVRGFKRTRDMDRALEKGWRHGPHQCVAASAEIACDLRTE